MRILRSGKRNGSSVKSSGQESEPSENTGERILSFIAAYVKARGFPPSLREIGRELGCSAQSVMVHLDRLESDGRLTRVPGIPRSIRLSVR